jgi:hypothetical protein
VGDAEALPHAQGVVADPSVGFTVGESDELEHLRDPGRGQAHRLARHREDLAAGAAGVLGGCVKQHADLETGVGQVSEPAAEHLCGAAGRCGEADDDAHGGRLPGPIGA